LVGSAGNPFSEQQSPPNLSLRAQGFVIINELRSRIHAACGQIVSCSDITALAARDAVFLSGGPDYDVPLGRRDGLTFATNETTLQNLPSFNSTAQELVDFVAPKGLDATDLVAISGAHTIGIGNCGSFVNRLYPPTQDQNINQTFADNLRVLCPNISATGTTALDLRSPSAFDNRYYIDLMNRQGLFVSDQDLFTNTTTRPIVTSFAVNQTLFFEQFVFSVVKMGMMNVTTGTQGEIRANCSQPNSATTTTYLTTLLEEVISAVF
jgi:peroxidase